MCKDLEGLLESKKHLRVETPCNDAERLILYRHDNSVEEGGVLAGDGAESLYGREGKFERDVLRRVRKIQSSARDVVHGEEDSGRTVWQETSEVGRACACRSCKHV